MAKQYPFRNLVFQGGGVKTLAYQGAITMLEKHGILPQVDRVIGTSAGAVMAMLLSFRLSAAETNAIFNTIDFSRIPAVKGVKDLAWSPPQLLEPSLERLVGNWDGVRRLIGQYGWYANDKGYSWLQDIIAQHCAGNGRATFADFAARGFRNLHVVATNISTRSVATFCAQETPNVAVADAMLMSQSLPLYFEAVQFDGHKIGQGDYYADGGVLNNYPLHAFDHPRFVTNQEWYVNGANWETLGFSMFTPADCPKTSRQITNLVSYMANLMEALIYTQDVLQEHNRMDQWRTVNISNCCVAITDFHIQSHPDDDAYRKLVAAGETATRQFLETYSPPSADQVAKLKRYFGRFWPS